MPKLLIISGNYPPDLGGPAVFVPALEQYLLMRGWRIQTLVWANRFHIESCKNYRFLALSRSVPFVPRVVITSILILWFRLIGYKIFTNSLDYCTYMSKLFIRGNYFHKIVGDIFFERKLKLLSQLTFSQQVDALNGPLSRTELFYWKFLSFSNSKIAVPSAYLKRFLSAKKGLNADSLKVIPNAASITGPNQQPHFIKGRRELTIASWGRFVPWKNMKRLVEAFTLLDKSQYERKVKLVLMGDGPSREDLIPVGGIQQIDFELMDALPHEQLQQEMKAWDIYVNLSSYEGMSHSLLEACECGLVIVASNIDPNIEVLELYPDVRKILISDPDSLVEVMEALHSAVGLSLIDAMTSSDGNSVSTRTDIDASLADFENLLLGK